MRSDVKKPIFEVKTDGVGRPNCGTGAGAGSGGCAPAGPAARKATVARQVVIENFMISPTLFLALFSAKPHILCSAHPWLRANRGPRVQRKIPPEQLRPVASGHAKHPAGSGVFHT